MIASHVVLMMIDSLKFDLKNLMYPSNCTDEPCSICANEMKAIELIGKCGEHKR